MTGSPGDEPEAMEELRPGVFRIEVPFAGASIIHATNCYLIEDSGGGLHAVDPGSAQEGSDRALTSALRRLGRTVDDVRTVVATHAHHDHIGWATRAPSQVRLCVGRPERATLRMPFSVEPGEELFDRWGVPQADRTELVMPPAAAAIDLTPDVLLDDGDLLDIPGRSVRVMATPGHTAGSICLDVDAALILTGDSVLPHVNPGLGMGGFRDDIDILGTAFDSLERLAALGAVRAGPGHGAPFPDLAARSLELLRRHRARGDEIRRLAGTGRGTVWDVANRVAWTGGWAGVSGYLRISALWQTELHLRRVTGTGDPGPVMAEN